MLEPAILHQFVRGILDKHVAMQLMGFKGNSNALLQQATAIEAGIRDYRDIHRPRSSEPPRREHLSAVVETTRYAPRIEPQSPPPEPPQPPRDDWDDSDSEFESGEPFCAAFDGQRQFRGRPRWNRGPRRPPPPSFKCRECGERGHWLNECPKRPQPIPGECFLCGGADHRARDCPYRQSANYNNNSERERQSGPVAKNFSAAQIRERAACDGQCTTVESRPPEPSSRWSISVCRRSLFAANR